MATGGSVGPNVGHDCSLDDSRWFGRGGPEPQRVRYRVNFVVNPALRGSFV